jgi:four helix bundle protein
MHRFKKLAVYEKALVLTRTVRSATGGFPRVELFGLTAQFRRAVDSIVLNIAEGAGNSSQKEFSRFLGFSIRSGFECLGCCDIALINGYMDKRQYMGLYDQINEIIAMLDGLRKSLFR